MNNILIPTDFSDNSINGVLYGVELAKRLSCSVTFVNTFSSIQKSGSLKSMSRILKDEAENEMNGFLRKLRESIAGVPYTTKIIQGEAVEVITSLVDSQQHDMVVMATKGASGIEEVFIGSVAGGVISRTKSPVIVVPEGCKYRPPELIILGLSGMPLASQNVVRPLKDIVKAYQSDVTVLHMANDQSDDIETVLEMVKDLNPSVMYAFGDSDINNRIYNYVSQSDADLLCLIRRRKGFFEKIFEPSVTLKQTFRSKIPLLILQNL